MTIEVRGPVVERAPDGSKGLRAFAASMTSTAMNTGKTEAGQALVLLSFGEGFERRVSGGLGRWW